MGITTVSGLDFQRDTGSAKVAALDGPVFITEAGVPGHVLLSIGEYRRLAGNPQSLADLLGWPPGIEDVEPDIQPRRDLPREVDLG